jgi:hypothetical protein
MLPLVLFPVSCICAPLLRVTRLPLLLSCGNKKLLVYVSQMNSEIFYDKVNSGSSWLKPNIRQC